MKLKGIISLVLAAIITASACVVVSAQSDFISEESTTAVTEVSEQSTEAEVTETVTEEQTSEATTEDSTVVEETVTDEVTSEENTEFQEESTVPESESVTEESTVPVTEEEESGIDTGAVPDSAEPESEKSGENAVEPDSADKDSDIQVNPYEDFVGKNLSDYKKMLKEYNRPTLSTESFFNIIKFINFPFKVVTGSPLISEEHMNVTLDAYIQDLSDDVLDQCGLDAAAILTNFPDINGPAELAVKVCEIDTLEFRNEMYAKRDELWAAGDSTKGSIYHFLGSYLSVIEKGEIFTEPTPENPDILEVLVRFTYKDGGTEILHPHFYINTVTGECTNKNNSGVFGIGFNFSITDMVVYATTDSWMRQFGFCILYDVAAEMSPIFFNYHTRRFKFDYNGLEWMVQMWKGNYLISNGAEVGLYSRTPDKFGSFYNCATDEQMIPMSMKVYAGDELLFEREEALHWWINGFKIDKNYYLPSSITLITTLTMPDEEMKNAFCEAIDNHYRHDVKYYADGLRVTVAW